MAQRKIDQGRCLRYFLLTAACYSVFLPVVIPLASSPPGEISLVAWVLIIVSIIANVGVLSYHYLSSPHPKFTCIPWRKRVYQLHMLSGTIELFVSVLVFLIGGNSLCGYIIALTALLFHVPTAYIFTPAVFGARAVMWPGYLICIGLHGFCAAMLFLHPESLYWTAATFLVLNVYVWVRVYFDLFSLTGLFPESQYSVAILTAEATVFPVVFGPASLFLMLLSCLTFILGYRLLFSKEDFEEFVQERPIEGVYLKGTEQLRDSSNKQISSHEAFARLGGRNGYIEVEKLNNVVRSGGMPRKVCEEFLSRISNDQEGLSLKSFETHIWILREFRHSALREILSLAERSDREKSNFIFDMLDIDYDGLLAETEIEQLLYAWGCPASDSRGLTHSTASLGAIDTETFFRSFKPLWSFLYNEVVEGRFGSRPGHLSRVFNAQRMSFDKYNTKRNLQHLLSADGADADALVQDFCESSVVYRFFDNQDVFVEEQMFYDIWFVLSGGVQITEEKHSKKSMCIEPGNWIDILENGWLLDLGQLSIQANSIGQTLLLRFDRVVFREFSERHPHIETLLLKDALKHSSTHQNIAKVI